MLVASGCASDLVRSQLEGRPCPCLPTFVCDQSSQSCVASLEELDGGAREDAGMRQDAASPPVDAALPADAGGDEDATSASDAGSETDGATLAARCFSEPTDASSEDCPAACDTCEGGACVFSCTGDDCGGRTLECPLGLRCVIECTAQDSCDSLRVVCPPEHGCEVACLGNKACRSLSVRCGGGPCELTCASGPQTCRDSLLQCGGGGCAAHCTSPANAPQVVGCESSCNGDCSCPAR